MSWVADLASGAHMKGASGEDERSEFGRPVKRFVNVVSP